MRLTELWLDTEFDRWREEVRAFLRAEMAPGNVSGHTDPGDLTGLDRDFERRHHQAAARRGFVAVSLPVADGGGGRSRAYKHVYDLEAAYHGAPSVDTGVTLCGFVLSRFGTDPQRARWLAPMVTGDTLGAIAYSEAGAGNNLAAIATTATRDAGGWVLSGTKSHVTGAHKAEVAVVLAVTDPGGPPRSSMTMFLVPLDAPGVQVVRRPTLNGWTLGEITFTQVRLDDHCVLGETGRGWSQVMAAVAAERGSLAYYGWAECWLGRLPVTMSGPERARLHASASRVRAFSQRLIDLELADAPVGYEASVVKVTATELLQDIARAAAAAAPPDERGWTAMFEEGPPYVYDALEAIHPTLSVGANETHRDMIAAALADRDLSAAPPLPDVGDDPVLAACATMAADARQVLALTAQHALSRPLYAKRVGEFQAAAHRFVDMAVAVEAMELTTGQAALVPAGPPRDYLASAAKVTANENLLDVVAGAHQLHGADGYYRDHPLAPYARRAWAAQAQAGTTAEHLDRLARLTTPP
ncbi:acyl-CoA dehydrogenase family protein [Candidatus Poriferisocius sp.]|uniref:acyl-CoA dehydrogenase family protein n=1 Tax=Candidatus Poriferisocius sp. TaxID=3101276 RepID=UPI003B5BF5A9